MPTLKKFKEVRRSNGEIDYIASYCDPNDDTYWPWTSNSKPISKKLEKKLAKAAFDMGVKMRKHIEKHFAIPKNSKWTHSVYG